MTMALKWPERMGKTLIKLQGMLSMSQTCTIRGTCSTGLILCSDCWDCLRMPTFLKLRVLSALRSKFLVIIFRHQTVSWFAALGLILKFHSD